MNTYNGTLSNGILWAASPSPEPAKAPKGLIVTRAVEVKGGFVGQVIVAESIVWEDSGWGTAQDAEEAATRRVVGVLRGLFAAPEATTAEQDGADQ